MRLATALTIALLALLAVPDTAGAGESGFTIDSFAVTRHPGEAFSVTGHGCPPTGSIPSPRAVHLRLTPPTGGNFWGPAMLEGEVAVFTTQAYHSGEFDTELTPNADGTVEATIQVPVDAPALDGYTVRGICTSLVVLEDGSDDTFTSASLAASQTEAGVLDVEAVPTSSTSTTSTEAPAPRAVAPTFTG